VCDVAQAALLDRPRVDRFPAKHASVRWSSIQIGGSLLKPRNQACHAEAMAAREPEIIRLNAKLKNAESKRGLTRMAPKER